MWVFKELLAKKKLADKQVFDNIIMRSSAKTI